MITYSVCSVEYTPPHPRNSLGVCLARGEIKAESANSSSCLYPKFLIFKPLSFYLLTSLVMGSTRFFQQQCSPVQPGARLLICPAPLGCPRTEQSAMTAYQGLPDSRSSGYDPSVTKPIQRFWLTPSVPTVGTGVQGRPLVLLCPGGRPVWWMCSCSSHLQHRLSWSLVQGVLQPLPHVQVAWCSWTVRLFLTLLPLKRTMAGEYYSICLLNTFPFSMLEFTKGMNNTKKY